MLLNKNQLLALYLSETAGAGIGQRALSTHPIHTAARARPPMREREMFVQLISGRLADAKAGAQQKLEPRFAFRRNDAKEAYRDGLEYASQVL